VGIYTLTSIHLRKSNFSIFAPSTIVALQRVHTSVECIKGTLFSAVKLTSRLDLWLMSGMHEASPHLTTPLVVMALSLSENELYVLITEL
jgi:hypothetical protein